MFMNKKKEKKISLDLNYVIAIILFSTLALNLFTGSFSLFSANELAGKIVEKTEEEKRPANLQITVIKDSDCLDCFSVDSIIEKIKSDNVNIEEVNTFEKSDEKGKELIEKYSIEKLPVFVVTGEIDKNVSLREAWGKIGEIIDGAVVFKSPATPYVEVSSGEVRGRIKLIIVNDESCQDCYDANKYKILLQQMKMSIEEEVTVEYKSPEGKRIIRENGIKSIPTIVIEGDLEAYDVKYLNQVGEIKGNVFVFEKVQTPYVEIKTNRVRGKVNIAIIKNDNCSECIDYKLYSGIAGDLRMSVDENDVYDFDSTEAKNLIRRYGIKALPTIIITGDLLAYDMTNLKKVGNIYSNAYVLTMVNPPYMSAITNKLVGNLDITILKDESCAECFDAAKIYGEIIEKFGFLAKSKEVVDVSSDRGKELIKKYKISVVPTMVIKGEFKPYVEINPTIWNQVGKMNWDGAYVISEAGVKQLGAYKNLTSGEVVR